MLFFVRCRQKGGLEAAKTRGFEGSSNFADCEYTEDYDGLVIFWAEEVVFLLLGLSLDLDFGFWIWEF